MIFKRSLTACNFKAGDRVKIRRSIRRGDVLRIVDDIDKINWVGKVPHYVEVKFDDSVIMMCNPSQLKRSHI